MYKLVTIIIICASYLAHSSIVIITIITIIIQEKREICFVGREMTRLVNIRTTLVLLDGNSFL